MIINKGYLTHESNECLIGCIDNYFKFFNIPITGTDICFYNRGLNIQYKIGEFDSLRVPYNYFNVLTELGVAYKRIRLELVNAKENLIELINSDTPIIAEIYSKNLFYDSTFTNYGSVIHTLNIVGYDCKEDKLCISDCYIPAFKSYAKQLWISAQEFINAWSDHPVLIILENLSNYEFKKLKTTELFVNQLNDYIEGKKEDDVYYGSLAVKRYFKEIKQVLIQDLNEEIVVNLNYQLHVFGFYMGRAYIRSFLEQIGKVKEAKRVEELINGWKMQCLSLTKSVITKNINKIEQKFNSIHELCKSENEVFLEIINQLT